MNKQSGQTALKMIVVIVITAIIVAAIAIPLINRSRNEATLVQAQAAIDIIQGAAHNYCDVRGEDSQNVQLNCEGLSLAKLATQRYINPKVLGKLGHFSAQATTVHGVSVAGSLTLPNGLQVAIVPSAKDAASFTVVAKGFAQEMTQQLANRFEGVALPKVDASGLSLTFDFESGS